MEKKEMSFIEKFEKASEELEKLKGDKCHMLTIAVDDESEKICAVFNGDARKISASLALTALRDSNFEEILRNAVKCIDNIRETNNK